MPETVEAGSNEHARLTPVQAAIATVVATLRGVGGDVLYCEEAAYMDLGVFYEVIVPLMEMRGAATICISTPVSTWNFYTELTEIRDDKGELLFNVIKVGMVCGRCEGTEHEADCTHPTGDRPEWKTETSEKVRAIYGHRKTLMLREVMGKVADDENMAFEARDLKAFFRRTDTSEPHESVRTVFVAVDPNGGASAEGGTGSQSAVVSFYMQGANVVVSLFVCAAAGEHLVDAAPRLGVGEAHASRGAGARAQLVQRGVERVRRQRGDVARVERAHERGHRPRATRDHVLIHAIELVLVHGKGHAVDARLVHGLVAFGRRVGWRRAQPLEHIALDQHGPVHGEHLQLIRLGRVGAQTVVEELAKHLLRERVVGVVELARVACGQRVAQPFDEHAAQRRVARHDELGHRVVGARAIDQRAADVRRLLDAGVVACARVGGDGGGAALARRRLGGTGLLLLTLHL